MYPIVYSLYDYNMLYNHHAHPVYVTSPTGTFLTVAPRESILVIRRTLLLVHQLLDLLSGHFHLGHGPWRPWPLEGSCYGHDMVISWDFLWKMEGIRISLSHGLDPP